MTSGNRHPAFLALGYCSNDHLCRLPEIPIDHKVEIIEHEIQGGGPAGDAAVCAARLGLASGYVGSMGDDDDGRRMLADFAAEGVDASGVVVRHGAKSPVAYCWITPDGRRSVAWTKNRLQMLDAAEVPLDLVRHARVLHLDGHHTEAAIAAAREARRAGVLVSYDAGTFVTGFEELLKNADILIASEFFARKWSGEQDVRKALAKLATLGATVTGVTMGEAGSMVIDKGEIVCCPAYKIQPVDTTGAGDAYHTGFAVKYLTCRDLRACMRFGSTVAALKCRKLGARTGLPTLAETEAFMTQTS